MVAFKKTFALIFDYLLHYYLKMFTIKENTNSIQKLTIFHHSSGKSIRHIAKLVNLSHSTLQYVIKYFKEKKSD